MKLKMLAWAVIGCATILVASRSSPTSAQVAGARHRETQHNAAASEDRRGRAETPKDEAASKGRGSDEPVSSAGERGEAALVSESYAGEDGGGCTIELVPGFDAGRASREATEPTKEDLERQRELQEIPPIERVLFGDQPETVCGEDERTRVSPTTTVPWRWNCQLILTMKDGGKARGTGWFIGPRTVMTAGHCVHTGKGGDWMQSVEVIPGMDGSSRPYGSQTSSTLRSVKGWTQDGNPEHDYGAVVLPDGTLGNKVGWFGFTVLTDSQLNNLNVNTAGYPGDKPSGTQWFTAGPITGVETRRLAYMLDTFPGQSGSAVWRLQNNQRQAVGIHNYGGCPNRATRITQAVFDNMTKWKNP